MVPFPLNENRFSVFVADHPQVGQLCTNPKSDRSFLSCLKSDTMFNERDRRCAAVQLMLSTDPSYDIRTIATSSKCKSGLPRITGTCPGWWQQSLQLWLWSLVWFQVRATSCHLTSSKSLESQHQTVPGCAEECGDPLVQSGGQWQTLGVAAGLGAGPQVQRDPGLASEGVLRLCTLLSQDPPLPPDLNPLDYFVWSYVENITNLTSYNTKASLIAAIRRVFAELPPALEEKACSKFRIRIEAEGGDIE